MKCTIMKCIQTNNHIHFALLQIRPTPVASAGLPSLARMLFNRPIRALLPYTHSEQINVYKDDDYCEALKSTQEAYTKSNDTDKDSTFIPSASTVMVQMESGSHWMHGMFIESNSKDHQEQHDLV